MFDHRFLVCVNAVFLLTGNFIEAQYLRSRALAADVVMADATSFHAAMLQRVNEERTKVGVPKLCYNKKLMSAAQMHSEDQASHGKLSHFGSDGRSPEKRVADAGYKGRGVAENVAAGQVDVKSVVDTWMNSDGHREKMLSKAYQHFGMGYAYNENANIKHYWTQEFAEGANDGELCDTPNDVDVSLSPTPAPTKTNGQITSLPLPTIPSSTPARTGPKLPIQQWAKMHETQTRCHAPVNGNLGFSTLRNCGHQSPGSLTM